MPATQILPQRKIGGLAAGMKRRAVTEGPKDPNADIKKGIWLYFLLLIFEGALRKWIIPQLAAPLLIIRDPVAIWLIVMANKRGLILQSNYLKGMLVIGFLSILTAMAMGHGSLPVALYGARILVLHFPLIFVIGGVFTRKDVIKIGKFTLLLTGPMALLIALQFYSPQSAWVNKTIGGVEGAGFSGALDFLRPPATFSFTNGTTLFFGFAAIFVLYFWLNPKGVNKLVLIAATVGLLMAIPLSISRALFFQVVITLLFAVMAISRKPENLGKLMVAIFGGIVALVILSKASFFQTATEAFTTRFDGANESEGGLEGVLGNRYLGTMWKSISESFYMPIFGYGIGMGTSVGGMLLSGEQTMLIYAEDEWARLTGEMGALMGLGVIFVRVGFCLQLAQRAYRKLSSGDLFPWLLLSFCLLTVPQGSWGQPTALGFSIIIGGFTLASFNTPRKLKIKPKSQNTVPVTQVNTEN
ncbi:MAG: hypothetical protein H7Z13_10645 [Ferruginibacter sp.]|nr:hypothetical protein [Ferruginibacter sp.]